MEALRAEIKRAAREQSRSRATTRHGIINSYDPDQYAVRVALQPEGTLTGWIPLKSPCAGNGWGIFAPPAIGTAVEVHFQEADGGAGSAGLSFFNDVERPLSVPVGEIWLVHQSGASIKLTSDGAITADTGQGASWKLKGGQIMTAGDWQHQGKLAVQGGDVTVQGGDVSADGISLKKHKHGLVKMGTDTSGPPQ